MHLLFLCKDLSAPLSVSVETTPGSGPQHSDKASCEQSQRVTFNHHSWGGSQSDISSETVGHRFSQPNSCGGGGVFNFFFLMYWAPVAFRHCTKLKRLKGNWDTALVLKEYLNPGELPWRWSQSRPLCKFRTVCASFVGAKVSGGVCHPELLKSKSRQNQVTDRWPTSLSHDLLASIGSSSPSQ